MDVKDLIITPIVIIIVIGVAYAIRPKVCTPATQRYFIPALGLKIIGALAIALIYEFYYQGGDAVNYYYHGTTPIWEAFLDTPSKAFRLILGNGRHQSELFEYSSRIWYYTDLSSYFVVRVGGIFSLITFNTWTSISVLFAVFSFSGMWTMYRAFLRFYPLQHFPFAIALFFIPSVVFWGSGMMKDTITLAALAWLTSAIIGVFFQRKHVFLYSLLAITMVFTIYSIKLYILMCFLPAAIIWVGFDWFTKIQRTEIRAIIFPLALLLVAGLSYLAIKQVGEGSARYSIENLSQAAEVTARWINYVSEVEGGSSYTLGDFDYSLFGLTKKFFPAIFVSLFQPFLWQASNPVMLISALESFATLVITLWVFYRGGFREFKPLLKNNSMFLFVLFFSLAFAAAVGFSTYNFGSLVRYKIPLLPYYGIALSLLYHYAKRRQAIPLS